MIITERAPHTTLYKSSKGDHYRCACHHLRMQPILSNKAIKYKRTNVAEVTKVRTIKKVPEILHHKQYISSFKEEPSEEHL